MGKKKSTQDILAALRTQDSNKGGESTDEPQAADAPVESVPPEASEPVAETTEQPAAKPKGPAPKSTKDILAALRSEGGAKKPAEPAAAAKPDKPAAKSAPAKAAAKPVGERPSVQEMVKAAREGKPGAKAQTNQPAAVAKQAPPKPKKPVSAKKAKAKDAAAGTRRNFLLALVATPFAAAWTMFSAASLAFLLGCARFMMPNVLVEPPSKFKIGPPTDYPPESVVTKWKPEFGVWIVNVDFEGKSLIYALSTVCTHLGCTPNWLEGEQKFKCPCHGSGFYKTGINFEGPAPRPLERMGIRLAADGMLEVDKSVKFQQEMGQWEDPASFVEVS